jgi:amino acid transporter
MQWLKRFLIGRPLKSALLKHEKYNVFWGLSVLSCDAISSVAYAPEAVLVYLVPALGLLAYNYLLAIAGAIILLLAILTVSYRQTIEQYPNGGGAYAVASDHLGTYAGIIAGVALLLDYTLTVAVSISSGIAQIASAFPTLLPYVVSLSLVTVVILYIGNLRGTRESSRIFGIYAYIFIFAIVSMIISGLVKIFVFGYQPAAFTASCAPEFCQSVTLFLLLKAFSTGYTALSGVETVSNAVPNFQEPGVKNAKLTLTLLATIVLILFGGLTILAKLYPIMPSAADTVLSQINAQIFGSSSFMYYFIQFATMTILVMAANTAYTGFPMMLGVMARDGYAPRQFAKRGERLTYSNGITILTIFAATLIIIFKASVTNLLGLYAIGVFISFTLSQLGMFMHWIKTQEKGWKYKAFVNGLGAVVTGITVLIITVAKFTSGAWIVLIIIPVFIWVMLKIKHHYQATALQLKLTPDEIKKTLTIIKQPFTNHVIVPIESINKAFLSSLRYAQSISTSIVAFHVVMEEESAKKLFEQWRSLKTDIPLIVKYSPYRKVVDPLMDFVKTYRTESCQPQDIITVVLTQYNVTKPWHIFMHNQPTIWIAKALLDQENVVIATIPLQLE